jgi:hypothetical protein
MDIKRWIVLVSIIVFFFGIYQAADAATLESSVVAFDTVTMQRGFPVSSVDKNFTVPVMPNHFSEKLSIKIDEENNVDRLPDGKSAVSAFYTYDLKTNYSGILKRPIYLCFRNLVGLSADAGIYFYDKHQGVWRELDSDLNLAEGSIRAKTVFPYAKVAVFQKKQGELTAHSAIVLDKNSNEVVYAKNTQEVRSIASLTKLMTALVFVENNPGWDREVIMQKSDFVGGATLWVKEGDTVTVKDLFYSLLVGSKNNAAEALVRASGLTRQQFMLAMNKKALDMGLTHSYFVEPTGLNERNVSTATELAEIAKLAFSNMDILQATTTMWYQVEPVNNDLSYWVRNTSKKVLERDLYVTGTKTGWTDEAGYCLVSQAKVADRELIALVMGAKIRQNYEEVYYLLKKYL